MAAFSATTWVAIGSVATAALAGVTVVLALATRRSTAAQFRPVLVPEGHPGLPVDDTYTFGFRNAGGGPALNVWVIDTWHTKDEAAPFSGDPTIDLSLGVIAPRALVTASLGCAVPPDAGALLACKIVLRYEDLAGSYHRTEMTFLNNTDTGPASLTLFATQLGRTRRLRTWLRRRAPKWWPQYTQRMW